VASGGYEVGGARWAVAEDRGGRGRLGEGRAITVLCI
jgi:hypothetical protein